MGHVKEVVPMMLWFPGEQRFRIVNLHRLDEDDQEAKPKIQQLIKQQKQQQEEDEDILSVLLQSIIETLPNPQPQPHPHHQDLKKKGVHCPVTCRNEPFDLKKKGVQGSGMGCCSYITCVICNASVSDVEGAIHAVPCGHTFCSECFPIYLSEKIQEDPLKVKCPVSKCKTLFWPKSNYVRWMIPEQVFDRWNRCLIESSVLAMPGFIKCPFESCGNRFVDDERGFLIRACPGCWKVFCIKCRVGWHMGKTCAQYELEVKMEMALNIGGKRKRWVGGRFWARSPHKIIEID